MQRDKELETRFVSETGPAGEIASLAEPALDELGFRLVRVKVSGRDGGTVQIMVERDDGTVSIDDCSVISKRLSPLLDAHDPMPGRYHLEISSPGIDRPLVRPGDFDLWSGYETKIELKELIDGRRRFRGLIEGYSDGEVRLKVEIEGYDTPQTIGIPVDLIASAKLVLNDDLIKASLAKGAGGKTENTAAEARGNQDF
jgi:ribosome maturation factor RimP